MNNYRVYVTWADGDVSTYWTDAYSASHACFLIGLTVGGQGIPEEVFRNVEAVIETN